MKESLLIAIGFLFIMEGVGPFLVPRLWRRAMQHMFIQSDNALRVFGLISMLLGLGLLYWFVK